MTSDRSPIAKNLLALEEAAQEAASQRRARLEGASMRLDRPILP